MLEPVAPQGERQPGSSGVSRKGSRWGALKLGCLGLLVTLCSGAGALAFVLQSGPVTLRLPGANTLSLGSESFVLSNYSFQRGTTYFLDLNGNGVRNIIQLHYLSDTRSLELVLHYADRSREGDSRIASMPLP